MVPKMCSLISAVAVVELGFHDSACYFLRRHRHIGFGRFLCLMLYWYINVLQDMLCILGFGIFKIIAVSIGGFLMPTAVGFSVSPCGQYSIGVLIVLKLGYQIILGRTVFVTFSLFWLCYNGSDVGLFAISICLPL
jgi:hypothetical protein